MSIQPIAPPHYLTVAEYLEIGELDSGYSELVEGRLLMSPSPVFRHNNAGFELGVQLRSQMPDDLRVALDIDVDLQLAPAEAPGTVRRPDLVVVHHDAVDRVNRDGGLFVARDVVVVVEILSPGSVRTDHVHKRGEYADAAIAHYWIVDISGPVSLLACHLAGEFGYADGGVVSGTFTTTTPFAAGIDLDALLG